MKQVELSGYIYHGTLDVYVPSFRRKLLNAAYWNPRRDFGAGLYTTSSLIQAKKWARSMQEKYAGVEAVNPAVLKIRILSVPPEAFSLHFVTANHTWAHFVYSHRLYATDSYDPCGRHPDIISGPLADGNTGKLVEDAIQLNKDSEWFYDQIVRNQHGKPIDLVKLGDQIVYCNEMLEASLRLDGFYIWKGRRWDYAENEDANEA
ncbi:DUF3990 domain-containing protein [Paenibacillus turpanensis]|uniref:DUF3990 domain-containing protein n=1 Tax=Paenibacillus turpanensis TaxID=2689078 RepID=UPI00140C02BB|nr:DUF3990 domain-containing protein [Paenibacillus turpanensis]